MTDLEYEGRIEIRGKKAESKGDGNPLTAYECVVLFDGKKIPFLEVIDVYISSIGKPIVLLKFAPIELDIKLDDADVFVRRKGENV